MFILAALVYPVVLAVLCVGAGLLVDRAGGRFLPGALLPAVGAAALIAGLPADHLRLARRSGDPLCDRGPRHRRIRVRPAQGADARAAMASMEVAARRTSARIRSCAGPHALRRPAHILVLHGSRAPAPENPGRQPERVRAPARTATPAGKAPAPSATDGCRPKPHTPAHHHNLTEHY